MATSSHKRNEPQFSRQQNVVSSTNHFTTDAVLPEWSHTAGFRAGRVRATDPRCTASCWMVDVLVVDALPSSSLMARALRADCLEKQCHLPDLDLDPTPSPIPLPLARPSPNARPRPAQHGTVQADLQLQYKWTSKDACVVYEPWLHCAFIDFASVMVLWAVISASLDIDFFDPPSEYAMARTCPSGFHCRAFTVTSSSRGFGLVQTFCQRCRWSTTSPDSRATASRSILGDHAIKWATPESNLSSSCWNDAIWGRKIKHKRGHTKKEIIFLLEIYYASTTTHQWARLVISARPTRLVNFNRIWLIPKSKKKLFVLNRCMDTLY